MRFPEVKRMVEKIFHKCSCGQGCFIQIPSYVHTKAIKDILSDVESRNPYPEDIFIEPSKKDWALLNSICRINGKMSESFMGSFGRLVWKNCVKEIQDSIDNSVQQDEVKPNSSHD